MKFLWELEKKNSDVITLPEDAAKAAKAQWVAGKPINFADFAFAASEVREIRKTSKVDTEGQRLLADAEAALANDRPLVVEMPDGGVAVKTLFIKKQVTKGEWDKTYSKHPNYKRVEGDGYWVQYLRPAHLGVPPGHVLVAASPDRPAAQEIKLPHSDEPDLRKQRDGYIHQLRGLGLTYKEFIKLSKMTNQQMAELIRSKQEAGFVAGDIAQNTMSIIAKARKKTG